MSTMQQTQLPAGTWQIDAVHSDIEFGVEYMAGTFRGHFATISAELADGALSGSAEVSSVQVKDPNLKAHLQSPEFFDAERHPQITFRSSGLARDGDEISIDGEITIAGATQPVELRGTISDPAPDPYGNERFGLKLETAVDRTAFGMNWNNPLPSGEPALANDVTIAADLQFVQAA
jgi:polyisoprenoid-binding protein YceI